MDGFGARWSGLPTAEDSIPFVSIATGPPARLGPPQQEDPQIDLDALIQPYSSALIAALLVLVLVLVVAVVFLARRTRRIDARLAGLTRGGDGASLEAMLGSRLDKVDDVSRELDELAARMAILEGAQRRAFQRVGLVRYNPFEETGGNQSFALALLDAAGDGWGAVESARAIRDAGLRQGDQGRPWRCRPVRRRDRRDPAGAGVTG